MTVKATSSWIIVDCDASDLTEVFIAVGRPDNWHPAFRDWEDGVRVAKIRIPKDAPVGRQPIFLRWGDHEESVGRALLRNVPAY